jgi:50S ribosomal subunit-associated GTPase HflX
MADTVGFIQKLHNADRAFDYREDREPSHPQIVDVNHPNVLEHIRDIEHTPDWYRPCHAFWSGTRRSVEDEPTLMPEFLVAAVCDFRQQRSGLNVLLDTIEKHWCGNSTRVTLRFLPAGDLVSQLHEMANVENQHHTEEGIELTVQLPPALYERFKEYRITG